MGRFIRNQPFIVALDFDGTLKRGKIYDLDWENWELTSGAYDFCQKCQAYNVHLVLWTCRNLRKTDEYAAVKAFLAKVGLDQVIDTDFEAGKSFVHDGVEYDYWGTGSLKQYADLYVDDLAVGFPLTIGGEPDWFKILESVETMIRRNR